MIRNVLIATSRIFIICNFFLSLLSIPYQGFSQGENNNWHFGQAQSMVFDGSASLPIHTNESSMSSSESSASVSDADGNLLFYSMGSKIWNKLGGEMYGSEGLLGNGPLLGGLPLGSSAEGVQIIANPANENQYYVFSGNAQEESEHKLYYSIVDMTLDGGLGAVVATEKNIQIMNNVSEFMCVTKGSDCKSYWIIARDADIWVRRFYAFKIDEDGIHEPVITVPPGVALGMVPCTKFFNDGVHMVSMGLGEIVFSKFNGETGEIYDFESFIVEFQGPIALSPDNTKFYALEYPGSKIVQYNLELLPNIAAVQASGTTLVEGVPFVDRYQDFRSGPDGRLYILRRLPPDGGGLPIVKIDYLENPNAPASEGVVVEDAFSTSISSFGYYSKFGPNFIKNIPIDTLHLSLRDTIVCFGTQLALTTTVFDGKKYLWNTGDTTPTITVEEDGIYWLYSFKDCKYTVDSFKVTFINFEMSVPTDTQLCVGDSFYINVYQPGIDHYLWNDNSTEYERWIKEPGIYELTMEANGCLKTSSFEVVSLVPYLQLNYVDTTICNVMPIDLIANTNLPSRFLWNNGKTSQTITPMESGMYIVNATSVCGTLSDTVSIEVMDCKCDILIPTAFSPNGDGLNDVFKIVYSNGCNPEYFLIRIFNRYGQLVFSGFRLDDGWDAIGYDIGTYYYELRYIDHYTGKDIYKKGDITLIR